jgi:hypothetical protein
MTSKAARHIELRENLVQEWVQDKTISVQHVAGKTNPADIFTKEMRDGVHFRDSYRLPGLMYPTLTYDGGLFVNLL